MKTMTSLVLIALMAVMPITTGAENQPQPPKPGDPQELWLAVCLVAFAGVAVGGIYVVSKRCQPKYYWLMDDDTPPKFWVGCPTKKECAVNNWIRIGGPYTRMEDAPAVHPNPTNRVNDLVGPVMKIAVQSSTNMVDWTTVYEENTEMEEFIYWPTNQVSGMYRLMVTP